MYNIVLAAPLIRPRKIRIYLVHKHTVAIHTTEQQISMYSVMYTHVHTLGTWCKKTHTNTLEKTPKNNELLLKYTTHCFQGN